MIRQRARLVGAQMAVVDALLLVAAFGLAYAIRTRWPVAGLPRLYPIADYFVVVVVAVPTCLICLWLSRVYRYRTPRPFWIEVLFVIRGLTFATVLVATLAFLLKWQFLSRSFLLLSFGLAAILLVAVKGLSRWLFRAIGRKRFAERYVLVVGSGGDAQEVVEAIRENSNWGLRLLGWVPLEGQKASQPLDAPRLGEFADLQRLLDSSPVDEVVFALQRDELHLIDDAVVSCEQMGIRTRLAVSLVPRAIGKLRVEEFHGLPLIDLSPFPDNEIRLALRRVFDIGLGGVALLLTSPLLILSAIAIKIEDGGPILFRQTRCGLNGRKFSLLKLRTMGVDADARKQELLPMNEMSGPVFKIKRDPRVTGVGAYLRRFSIDELPQLWNVLTGDMAVVGPRPPLPDEVERYERWQRRRLSMKPGMTGLWQVSGRSDVDFEEWMRLDLRYIDNWSFWLDLKILLKTVPAVISGRGAL